MPKRVLLLTGEIEAPHLTSILTRENATLDVVWVPNRESLDRAVEMGLAGARLIAVMTSIIVPEWVLRSLDGPAYNFHPGPPEYPGSYVAGFAVYDGAATFGVTLHEMAARVDTGPIIDVRRFEIAPHTKFQQVEIKAFEATIHMFADYASHMANDDAPLPLSEETWSGPHRTTAQAEKLRKIESDLTEEEINRRYRAFG